MEESCPGKEGHPPSQFNFNERLYEKPFVLFAWSKSWQKHPHMPWLSCLDRVDPVGRVEVFYGEKLVQLGG